MGRHCQGFLSFGTLFVYLREREIRGDVVEQLVLTADVNGDEIIVRTLGFFAAYTKPSNAPQLILKRRTDIDDHDLLAQAWQAANEKAREIGWIV